MIYNRRINVSPLVGILLLSAVVFPIHAQVPDTTFLPPTRADGLTGLYLLEDGRAIHVLDLRDQLNGRQVLSVTEYETGRIRALYPLENGDFEAGNQWFRRDSVAYRIRFDEVAAPAPGLTWEEAGRTINGYRAPLVEREVAVENGDIHLAGTLVIPSGPGPHPAVVMETGSGPETRRVSRYMGDLLAFHGMAVLVMDKRGTGGSTGSWYALSHADWAADVERKLDFLRTQPEIDSTRMGLFGNSESGFVVPVVAANRTDVRFLVCRVCSAMPQPHTIVDTQRSRLSQTDLSEDDVELAIDLLERMMSFALTRTGYDDLVAHAEGGTGQPWRESMPPQEIPASDAAYWDNYRANLIVDPKEFYAQLKIPVLVVLGEADDRILMRKHSRVLETLKAEGLDLDFWEIPGATHGLMVGSPGSRAYPPGLHDRIARWVASVAGVKVPQPRAPSPFPQSPRLPYRRE